MSRGIHRNNNQQWIMVKRVHHFLLYIALFLLLVIFRGMWRAVTVLDRHLQAEDYHQLTTMMTTTTTTLLSDKKASLRLQSREQRQHQNVVVAVEQNRDRMVQSDIVEIVSSDANNISQTVPSQTTTKTLSVELSPTPPLNTDDSSRRFLVFHGKHRGQGSGNIMQGLLSAHLFGLEFNRTVCVLWPAFFTAFEYSQPQHKDLCQGAESWHATPILMWNFAKMNVTFMTFCRILKSTLCRILETGIQDGVPTFHLVCFINISSPRQPCSTFYHTAKTMHPKWWYTYVHRMEKLIANVVWMKNRCLIWEKCYVEMEHIW